MVCTLFGIRVREHAWLAHRLELISAVTAPSLLAQQDQHFNWVILVDQSLPDDIRCGLEEMLKPFGGRALLQSHRGPVSWVNIAREHELSEGHRYLLTGRIDDDDAWSTSVIDVVRKRAAAWLGRPGRARGLGILFPHGLEWIMYEMLDVDRLQQRGEHLVYSPAVRTYQAPAISANMFACTRFVDPVTVMGPESDHARRLIKRVKSDGETVQTKMPMWLCCRHKQNGSGVRKADGPELNLSLAELAEQFGLDTRRVQAYLDSADKHQYAIERSPTNRKAALAGELVDLAERIDTCSAGSAEMLQLRRRQEELKAEIDKLEVNILGDPESLIGNGAGTRQEHA